MRADADLMVYVAARWPSLVREAVLLGVPPDQAAEAATDALSRCRRAWGSVSRAGDVDALVRDALVRQAARQPRTAEGTREQDARELLVLAPPTLDELRRRERAKDRAALRRTALVAVPVLLVATVAGWYVATHGGSATPSDGALHNAA